MAEAAGAEVDADPDSALFVFEDIDVMVATADGAELCPGHVAQRGQPPSRAVGALLDLPGVIVVVVEELVIDWLLVFPGQAEADG